MNAIGEYIDQVEEKKNWAKQTHGKDFWYGNHDHISALQNLRRQLVCISVHVDILDDKILRRAFPCMEIMEGTDTWFKSFMTIFGNHYELEPHCNLATMKYTIKMVWLRQLK